MAINKTPDFQLYKKRPVAKNRVTKSTENNLLLAKYLNVGYYLIAPLILGVFFGLLIDKYLDTRPIFTFIFLGGGAVSTFYNLYKIIKETY